MSDNQLELMEEGAPSQFREGGLDISSQEITDTLIDLTEVGAGFAIVGPLLKQPMGLLGVNPDKTVNVGIAATLLGAGLTMYSYRQGWNDLAYISSGVGAYGLAQLLSKLPFGKGTQAQAKTYENPAPRTIPDESWTKYVDWLLSQDPNATPTVVGWSQWSGYSGKLA